MPKIPWKRPDLEQLAVRTMGAATLFFWAGVILFMFDATSAGLAAGLTAALATGICFAIAWHDEFCEPRPPA